ncbi:MAG: hypothetical protein M0R30_10980 [Methanoregula sp.]|uniref:hypothetical protein n=1 Tax=Methanoregula sp. TaxID=2052170 RepID=UPI0025CEED7A|nr:hypothetical protein [Methanoregula sp.]MCK9632153.1 hypothetical protein [Methanoregula sp.]
MEEQKMAKGKEHNNRLWWMASAVVLLFVALAVAPVAASNVIYTNTAHNNNHTYIPMANPPIQYSSTYLGDPYYYVNLTNTTGGLNAIHITNDISDQVGACYESPDTPNPGTFYVSDTGGRGGQQDIILLIAINSTNVTDITNFNVDVKEHGYRWLISPKSGSPPDYPNITYVSPSIDVTLNADNYLENDSVDLFQKWKFAPTADYPVYCGQDMGSTSKLFKFLAVDNKVGTINGTWYNLTYPTAPTLTNNGMTKIEYNITSGPSSNATIAFNVYAYNNQTLPQKVGGSLPPAINWLNRVRTYDDPDDGTYSGWKVTV